MSTITKEIVRDLLPVYLSGEASADTRNVVEEFLASDADLRAVLESARETRFPDAPEPAQALEMHSLDRTRVLLNRKMWLFTFSLVFSLIPTSFAFDSHGIVFLMARDQPWKSGGSLLLALAGWTAFLDTCRRLSMTGMQAPQTWKTRFFWALTGVLLGANIMLVLMNWAGDVWWLRAIPPVCMFGALRLGERWNQVRPRSR